MTNPASITSRINQAAEAAEAATVAEIIAAGQAACQAVAPEPTVSKASNVFRARDLTAASFLLLRRAFEMHLPMRVAYRLDRTGQHETAKIIHIGATAMTSQKPHRTEVIVWSLADLQAAKAVITILAKI